MIRSPISSLQLCFFPPLHGNLSSGNATAHFPFVSRVVLVSSPSQDRLGFDKYRDIEGDYVGECQDCPDCDCACFTNDG